MDSDTHVTELDIYTHSIATGSAQYSSAGFEDRSDDALSSDSFAAIVEQTKARARNGRNMSSLHEFVALCASLGLKGPEHLRQVNLRTFSTPIGQGSQFIVFKKVQGWYGRIGPRREQVYKRVKIPLFYDKGHDASTDQAYRSALRHLELETLSLSDKRLRDHRNIVTLIGWALDYDDRFTGIPVLKVEAALCSLSDLLAQRNTQYSKADSYSAEWALRYHLALDVASGLEAIHSCDIIHGDVKPDNILIFKQDHPWSSYIAKLGDFGVALDMQDSTLEPRDYRGTPSWTGPENGLDLKRYNKLYGNFEPWHLKTFDSFSFGILLMSLFVTNKGYVLNLTALRKEFPDQDLGEIAKTLFSNLDDIPNEVSSVIHSAVSGCLREIPSSRSLPTPNLLLCGVYEGKEWTQINFQYTERTIDGQENSINDRTGPAYWSHLDDIVADQLYKQHLRIQNTPDLPRFPGSTLLGLAQKFARSAGSGQYEKVCDLVLQASKQNHIPAQAICERLFESQHKQIPLKKDVLQAWCKNSILTGYLFHGQNHFSSGIIADLRSQFRRKGGYCTDVFLRNRQTPGLVSCPDSLQRHLRSGSEKEYIDTEGNTLLHICAAIGHEQSLHYLASLDCFSESLANVRNETPIYKACQAGNLTNLSILVERGYRCRPRDGAISEVHWLFAFEKRNIELALDLLVRAGADINQMFKPANDDQYSRFPSRHFPFNWPFGTPLHWAVFARSKEAINALAARKALLDRSCSVNEPHKTPLLQAIDYSDCDLVRLLLALGANPHIKDTKGRNMLHHMSLSFLRLSHPGPNLQTWIRSGPYEDALRSKISISEQLISAGVSLEQEATSNHRQTPLLMASSDNFSLDVITAQALLTVGADPNAIMGVTSEKALDMWITAKKHWLIYPQAYDFLIETLIERTVNIDTLRGINKQTTFQAAASSTLPLDQISKIITLLTVKAVPPANINALDGSGRNALMRTIVTSSDFDELKDRINMLVQVGVHPATTDHRERNILIELLSNDRLLDRETEYFVRFFTAEKFFDRAELSRFIENTDSSVLGIACAEGKPLTIQVLFDLGMSERINRKLSARDQPIGTALDLAFGGAQSCRDEYLSHISLYRTKEQLERAEQDGSIFSYNCFGHNQAGQPGMEREKEKYWAWPKVFELLLRYGGKRTPINSSRWPFEPSFRDAEMLGPYELTESDIRHREHWKPLFDLELLEPGWEDACFEKVKQPYIAEPSLVPTIQTLQRWPRLAEVLKPIEGNRYRASERGANPIEVEIRDDEVTVVRNYKTEQRQDR